MKLHPLGLRTIKTSLAVSLTLVISDFLFVTNPFFAAIAAIIAMEPSMSATFDTVRDRMFGTILGAVLALVVSLTLPVNAWTIGLGVLLVIYLSNQFHWQGTIKISSIVFLAILIGYEPSHQLDYALYRTLDTFLGLAVGTLVNTLILPHDVGEKAVRSADEIIAHLVEQIEALEGHHSEVHLESLRTDINTMVDQLTTLKKELKFNAEPTERMTALQRILNRFERVYHHLAIIDAIDSERDESVADLDQLVQYHNQRIFSNMQEIFEIKGQLSQIEAQKNQPPI